MATSFTSGASLLDLAGERAGGVVEVELFAVEAEEEDEGCEDRDQGGVADLGDAPAADDEEDDGSEEECGCGGDQRAIGVRGRGSRTSCAGERGRGRRP